MKTNLLNIEQLQEKGYEIAIKGVCRIQDPKKGLIAQFNMTTNRMFPLHIRMSQKIVVGPSYLKQSSSRIFLNQIA